MSIEESTQLLSKGASLKLLTDMLKQAEEEITELLTALKDLLNSRDVRASAHTDACKSCAVGKARIAIRKVEDHGNS